MVGVSREKRGSGAEHGLQLKASLPDRRGIAAVRVARSRSAHQNCPTIRFLSHDQPDVVVLAFVFVGPARAGTNGEAFAARPPDRGRNHRDSPYLQEVALDSALVTSNSMAHLRPSGARRPPRNWVFASHERNPGCRGSIHRLARRLRPPVCAAAPALWCWEKEYNALSTTHGK